MPKRPSHRSSQRHSAALAKRDALIAWNKNLTEMEKAEIKAIVEKYQALRLAHNPHKKKSSHYNAKSKLNLAKRWAGHVKGTKVVKKVPAVNQVGP